MKTVHKYNYTKSRRAHFRPIRNLTPERLSRELDAFHLGDLRPASLTWDAIERRDDVLQGVISKRKKAVARLGWEIITTDDSPEAHAHKAALEYFYNQLTSTHACDENERGGMALLIKQMMDAVGKKYAVHEITYETRGTHSTGRPQLTATLRFVPLWFFENREGHLRFLKDESSLIGETLEDGGWLVTKGDGLMEASSIAYLFKHLPMRDWLIYCERNGMPGVKGITDAVPNSPEWEAAREAVSEFGSEFHALMTRGSDIQAIDLTARGELPYPRLIERMDRAMIALWRGADLSTLSSSQGTGASLQQAETDLIEDDDAWMLSETLQAQIDRVVLRELFNTEEPRAYIQLKVRDRRDRREDLDLCERLLRMGLPIALQDLYERFGLPRPSAQEPILEAGA
ncbi:MAG: hypothetical protein B7X06_00055 [Verrucomicrobia bacterium 21-51-4]|nr:MAG: hypothetical protein B7X06_00055 [Verrucomicrobia bacterium 21-51-4]HQU08359.1 DUF935 family protein [Opitutales bacterium]